MVKLFFSKLDKQKLDIKKLQKKILIILFSLLTGIILFFSIFSDGAMQLYEKYFINDHREVLAYLDKIEQYNRESTEIVDNIRLNLYRKDLAEFSNDIKKGKDNLQQIMNQSVALKAPKGFVHHKALFQTVLKQRMLVLATYESTKKTYNFGKIKTEFAELNDKQNMERKELLKSFKMEGINYKQLADGSIRYWYKSYSAKSLKKSI